MEGNFGRWDRTGQEILFKVLLPWLGVIPCSKTKKSSTKMEDDLISHLSVIVSTMNHKIRIYSNNYLYKNRC